MNGSSSLSGRLSDQELVRRCVAGDKPAWTALFDRYERLIYGIARSQGLNESQASDVYQNVAIILLQSLEQLRNVDRLASWLITVTRRESWKELSRRDAPGGDDPQPLLERQADERLAVDEAVALWDEYLALYGALEELEARCRTLLHRLFFARPAPSYQEIAAELGIPIGSIGPTRARCLNRLREMMVVREAAR